MIGIQTILKTLAETDFDREKAWYLLLAKTQDAAEKFEEGRLYPHLAQLVKAHRSLSEVREELERKYEAVKDKKEVVDIDWEKGVLERESVSNRDLFDINDVEKVVSVFVLVDEMLGRVESLIKHGKSVFDDVEEKTEIETVGIVPSYRKEGYMFIPDKELSELHIERYTLFSVRKSGESYAGLKTSSVKQVSMEPAGQSLSDIKLDLLEERQDLPNPATFYFATDATVPLEETLLPVTKRMFMRHLKNEP